MIYRLLTGAFEPAGTEAPMPTLGTDKLDKRAMLVYSGKFDSLDGPVEIKDEHLDKLATTHNSLFSKLSRLATGEVPLKSCPPIQLDHSTSAKDTVGRLVGNLEVGEHQMEDGSTVKALYGNVRILGKENVEKVADGRWTNLSIGADLETGKLSELTITPFPAAPDAALLAKLADKTVYDSAGVTIYQDSEGFYIKARGAKMYLDAKTRDEAIKEANEETDMSRLTKLVSWQKDTSGVYTGLGKNPEVAYGFEGGVVVVAQDPSPPHGYLWEIEFNGSRVAAGKAGRAQEAKAAAEGAAKKLGIKLSLSRLVRWHKDSGDAFGYLDECEVAEAKDKKGEDWYLVIGKDDDGKGYVWEVAHNEEPMGVDRGRKYGSAPTAADAKGFAERAARGIGLTILSGWKMAKRLASKVSEQSLGKHGDYDYKLEKYADNSWRVWCSDGSSWNQVSGDWAEGGQWKDDLMSNLKEHVKTDGEAKKKASQTDGVATDPKKLSKGEDDMDKEKMKKHLMDEKKMTDEEAEKHLAEASDEDKKALAAEVDEKEKKMAADKKEEDEKKMKAAKESLTRLTAGFKKSREQATLLARKGKILTRLSRLRASAKITPAEIKKLDVEKMASNSPELIDAVLKSYEDREPVLLVGVYGSTNAEQLSAVKKKIRMSKLELETRKNMSMLQQTVQPMEGEQAAPDSVSIHVDTDPHDDAQMETHCAEIDKLMDEGKLDEAKKRMREYMRRHMGTYSAMSDGATTEDTEKQMSALAETVEKMQTDYDQLVKLANSFVEPQ